jgi:hypothetical protein
MFPCGGIYPTRPRLNQPGLDTAPWNAQTQLVHLRLTQMRRKTIGRRYVLQVSPIAGIRFHPFSISTKSASNLLQSWQNVYGRTQPLILRTQNSAVRSSKTDPSLGNNSRASRFRSATTIEEMSTLLPIFFYFDFQPLPHNISIFDSPLPVSISITRSYGISTSSTAYGRGALRFRTLR